MIKISPRVSCFVAYPSKSPSLVETIEQAITEIRKGQVVEIDSWQSTAVTGKFIMLAICKAIEQRDIFICDLTTLNHNVLFELGYAIAKNKRIWILLNPSIQRAVTDYNKFKLLTTVGYAPYRNTREICDVFYEEQPYKDLESTIFKEAIESVIRSREKPILLYLRSGIETQESVKLSRAIRSSHIASIVDDPSEVRVQTLSWYSQKVHSAHAVIAHFLSAQYTDWRLHNAKNSFVSGLAYGFGKHLLMLAHEPYESPIDYRELLKTHGTASSCELLAQNWLTNIEDSYSKLAIASSEYEEELRAHSELQNIAIGDSIAENESEALPDYFVTTAAYNEALACKDSIFVGRKGSGKTAILYQLAKEMEADTRNHVCIIQPIAYELEGVLGMLSKAIPRSEKGYLIESFWKFLIYTELAKSLFETLRSKPLHYQPGEFEEQLLKFVEENDSIITLDFSIRLETIVNKLQDLDTEGSAADQRLRISELLHSKLLATLRSILGNVLHKKNKVAILVDNLDKAWRPREDLPMLCDLLFGLLGVSKSLALDFRKSDHRRQPVSMSLMIFLRSDIFTQMMKQAHEKDKVTYSRITWHDKELLLRVLEERFLASSNAASPSAVWSRYFCSSVKGVPTREHLTNCILPRPRDLIYLSKAAIAQAVNRRHTRVNENDIIDAQKKYSQYALDSIIVENSIQEEVLEELLYEFVGAEEVVDREFILKAMKDCKIHESKFDEVIELLCDLTFLGREVEIDRFEFLYDEEDKTKWQAMARKITNTRIDKKVERFLINQAFHAYLEIKSAANP